MLIETDQLIELLEQNHALQRSARVAFSGEDLKVLLHAFGGSECGSQREESERIAHFLEFSDSWHWRPSAFDLVAEHGDCAAEGRTQ